MCSNVNDVVGEMVSGTWAMVHDWKYGPSWTYTGNTGGSFADAPAVYACGDNTIWQLYYQPHHEKLQFCLVFTWIGLQTI
jgi:hypothetical protein